MPPDSLDSTSPIPSGALRSAASINGPRTLGALVELTKPRLNFFSVTTAVAGYAVADGSPGLATGLLMTLGTALSGAGALGLNQWIERDTDAMMKRTRDRPLPRGDVTPNVALVWSLSLAIAGVATLAFCVNTLAAVISALTIGLYVAAYTPLKRKTRWATEVGALPGALPPLIGAAAADNAIGPMGWFLFALMLFWQMPHFFAIGWICRDEYRTAGFRLLPAIDATGKRTAAWTLAHTVGLAVVSVVPWTLGMTGTVFNIVALQTGLTAVLLAVRFALSTTNRDNAARQLFFALLIYLPIVLGVLVFDRIPRAAF